MQVEKIDRDLLYLTKLADWCGGQGFCQIEGLTDPDEWCFEKWDELRPDSNGDDYSAEALAQSIHARHRHQVRAEVVGEIVAMLDERISVYEQKRNKADPLADETYNRHEAITYVLEALEIVKLGVGKFGGRDAD